MQEVKNRAELLLLLLLSGEVNSKVDQRSTSVEGITRLEKLLFLLKTEQGFLREVPDKDDFHFVPFRMGPWSQEVYDEVDFLESLGLIEKKTRGKRSEADLAHDDALFNNLVLDKYQKTMAISDSEAEVFQLTPQGRTKALQIYNRLPTEEKEKLISLKRRFNRMNLRQLLRYVYEKYPAYTTESEIKDYLGIRESADQ